MEYTAHFGLPFVWVRIGYPRQRLHDSWVVDVLRFPQKSQAGIIGHHIADYFTSGSFVKLKEHKYTHIHHHVRSEGSFVEILFFFCEGYF